ncbi:DNA-methyltransferase Dcm [Synechococcus sp. PCC 7502]|uniref:DNA cytosine methyltransferase n=1 Tax=Synechococcus sp. PCC 7502 TaxID=1173263 RepID=UPI00029F9B23|nr:DNA cytosine methyltransferase [Synechococcus sp. PCC 7502]AFY73956.1 DNA-methyltransferase Dcm [Synechococcus sp. PCC 7502]
MFPKRRPIAVDLFAGAGGMTLGFEQAGFDVLASVEINPVHCAIHKFNFPHWSVICQSVTDISGDEIRTKSTINNAEIDVVFGGSPCQGFSLIGKRALDDPRNALVSHFLRLVTELNPKYFVLENVKGLTIGKHRQFLAEVIAEFESHNYEVLRDYRVLNASHYGVPQSRDRLFLIGCRQGLKLPNYPLPITKPPKLGKNPPQEFVSLPNCPTVWDAIADLPKIENYPELMSRDFCIAEYGECISDYARLMKGLINSSDDYSYLRVWNPQLLTSSIRTIHSLQSMERFEATDYGKTEPISHFHKLDPNGICNTLRAGTPSNRGAFTSPRPIHPYLPRCITVREAARLHSYPDWFRFHGTKWHGFQQVGNSVPPLLAKVVASELIKVLNIQPVKPQQVLSSNQEELLQLKMTEAANWFGVDRHIIELRKPRNRESLELDKQNR